VLGGKPVTMELGPPQIPNWQTLNRTQASAVGAWQRMYMHYILA